MEEKKPTDINMIIKIAIRNVMMLRVLVVERNGRTVANKDNAKDISMVMFAMQDYLFKIALRHDIKYNKSHKHSLNQNPLLSTFFIYFWRIRLKNEERNVVNTKKIFFFLYKN